MRAAKTTHGRFTAQAMELRGLVAELRRLTRDALGEV